MYEKQRKRKNKNGTATIVTNGNKAAINNHTQYTYIFLQFKFIFSCLTNVNEIKSTTKMFGLKLKEWKKNITEIHLLQKQELIK